MSSLTLAVAPLRVWLDDPSVTELCIQAPGAVWVERAVGGFTGVAAEFVTPAWCTRFAKLLANYSRQRVDEATPLLSAALPSGERVQVVLPPAARFPVLAIRRPAATAWSLAELAGRGIFGEGEDRGGDAARSGQWAVRESAGECAMAGEYAWPESGQTALALEGPRAGPRALCAPEWLAEGVEGGAQEGDAADASRADGRDASREALRLAYQRGDARAFLSLAVRARLNILVSGATGSGKTTLTKALIGEIPAAERLVSIEDAAELSFGAHPNAVQLFYSKEAQGRSQASPRQLLEASLRLRPDRILLAELRGEEAFYYLRNVNSGHPGSITSIHASSALGAIEQLVLLVKQSPEGRGLTREEVRELVRASVEVIVQVERDARGMRRVREWWWGGVA